MKRILFYVIVGLQALFLVGMSVAFYLIDLVGEEAKLKTLPVDPQDPFYGDYLTLRYEAEEIDPVKWKISSEMESGDKVFVTLAENEDGIYQVEEVTAEPPGISSGQVMLTGFYQYYSDFENLYYVDYGLNRYYIEDNTGLEIEQSGELIVTVAIAPWGQKKIVTIE
ncbi:GDYXXLXY domain-containing protein [Gracilibacillus xinjiangensis]|uniref:GDYXXLXY domain-containing protein n=1 Tax=Gracilibacillus xinjiangensis TaxID=1193282 RepID=A0ABV8WVC2_9BACI